MDNETQSESKPPKAVQVTSVVMHGLVQLAVWGAGIVLMLEDKIPPIEGFGICGLLTGLGVWQVKRGLPPVSVLVTAGQALTQAIRHGKGLGTAACIVLTLSLSGCGQSLQDTARDVTDHVVFRGTLGGLLGACATTQGAHSTWDSVCDAAHQVDAVRDLLQSGAGPAELPPEVASRECVAFEDGTVDCDAG